MDTKQEQRPQFATANQKLSLAEILALDADRVADVQFNAFLNRLFLEARKAALSGRPNFEFIIRSPREHQPTFSAWSLDLEPRSLPKLIKTLEEKHKFKVTLAKQPNGNLKMNVIWIDRTAVVATAQERQFAQLLAKYLANCVEMDMLRREIAQLQAATKPAEIPEPVPTASEKPSAPENKSTPEQPLDKPVTENPMASENTESQCSCGMCTWLDRVATKLPQRSAENPAVTISEEFHVYMVQRDDGKLERVTKAEYEEAVRKSFASSWKPKPETKESSVAPTEPQPPASSSTTTSTRDPNPSEKRPTLEEPMATTTSAEKPLFDQSHIGM